MAFTFIIQGACRLVKDQNWGILQKYSGNGNSLFLSAGEPCSTFAYIGVVTVRQGHNEIMNVGTPCCVYDFFHESSRLSVGDIFLDGSTEQINVLLDNSDIIPEGF